MVLNPLPFQLMATFGVALMLVNLARRRARRAPVLWLLLWGAGLLMVWRPDLSDWFAHWLGITRGVDVVTFTGIGLLSWLMFRQQAALERQEQVITRLVSELALRDLDRPVRAPEQP